MFGRKDKERAGDALEGVMTFFGSHHALRAESVMKKAGFPVRLVPGPREISPNCGVALRFSYDRRQEAVSLLEVSSVQFEAVHYYPER
jgi:Protein of unknown function (DUF3343)